MNGDPLDALPDAWSQRPLEGVRVLDLTRLLPGNYCTWLLAVLGADVIKIEDTGAGDYMRSFGHQVEGQGAIHHLANRGKRSISLNLKQEEARRVFDSLVGTADVVIDSFRPGALGRIGIDYAELRKKRPQLVCVSINGHGADGPMAMKAAHDLNFLALVGHLDRNARAGELPAITPMPWADLIGGGLMPALSIVSFVHRARQTGIGATIDSPIAEGTGLLPNIMLADILAGGYHAGPGLSEWAGGRACYDVYRGADCLVAVGAVEPHFWQVLCEVMDLEELIPFQTDPEEQDRLRAQLTEAFSSLTREDVERLFAERDGCVTVVNSFEEFTTSEFARSRGLVRHDPEIPMPVLVPPFVVDGKRPAETSRAPFQGEQTNSILQELGLSPEEIEVLVDSGAAKRHDGVAHE